MPILVYFEKSHRFAALGSEAASSSTGTKKSPARAVFVISGMFQLVRSSAGFFGPLATNFGNQGQVLSYWILQL